MSSLKKIDELIENSKAEKDSNIVFDKLAKLIVSYFKIEGEDKDYKTILDREIDSNKKRFISFCILRIWSINSHLIEKSMFKHKILNFLEDSLPDVKKSLYKNKKIENYRKFTLLRDYVRNIEKNVKNEVDIDIDLTLKGIKSYKKAFLAAINNKKNKALLNLFLGDLNVKYIVENTFNAIIEYLDSEIKEKFLAYNNAVKEIDDCLEKFEAIGTKYSIEFIYNPVRKLKEKLQADFRDKPYTKPAILKITKTEKKYPIIPEIKSKVKLQIINEGSGNAYNTRVKFINVTNVNLDEKEEYIGEIEGNSKVIIDIGYVAQKEADSFFISGYIIWQNFDNKEGRYDFNLKLEGQEHDINWEELENLEPYDLEPVTRRNEFIGRSKILKDLEKSVKNKVKSSYIFGQRRVGKTSIVKTLQSIINSRNLLSIYIEAGDWNNAKSPEESMNDLGNIICKKISKFDNKFKSLTIPDFKGSFNKITDFLDDVLEIDDSFKCLIILDEFDRISDKLLYGGDIAKSFLLTIRSISNRPQFGFILVGGEKLEFILSQWDEFNKFIPIRVDYFNKETEWSDFTDLIKKPISKYFEVSDEAIDYLYSQTSGNPYFTKKICIELFDLMVRNRDKHITEAEAQKAVDIALSKVGATDFSHFWQDAIKETEFSKKEVISIHRRKVFLAIANLLQKNKSPLESLIIDEAVKNGLSELEATNTLKDFVQRKILYKEGEEYKFVMKFLESWLLKDGVEKIITTFDEEQRLDIQRKREEDLKVKSKEIIDLEEAWGTYRGEKITADKIRFWLEQFDNVEEQRLMFKLLKNLKLYTNNEIREKMEDLFKEVRKEIKKAEKIRHMEEGKLKRNDILVSYLDNNYAKSGAEYGKLFTEVNNIYKDNAVSIGKILQKLESIKNINAIVFIDDFIGTGQSIIENIANNLLPIYERLKKYNIIIILGIIAGFIEAKFKIQEYCENNNIELKIIILDPLDNKDKAFSEENNFFSTYIEREKAKKVCKKIGLKIEKHNPLGYGNCQALVVFPNTCPNNSLPILWKQTKDWMPLFKR